MSVPQVTSSPLATTSFSFIAPGVVFLSLFALYKVILYPLFLSPLRHVPGPRLAAITSLYLDCLYYKDDAIRFVHRLHARHGPIVRVGPSEVVVNDPRHLAAIYGARSAFPKPPTAVLNQNYGCPNAFSSVTREAHRESRRQTARVYAAGAVLNNGPLAAWIRDRLDVLLGALGGGGAGRPTDVYALAGYLALDVVSYQVYGESLDLLGGHHRPLARGIRDVAGASVPLVRFSWWFAGVLRAWPRLGSLLLPEGQKRSLAAVGLIETTNRAQIARVRSHGRKPDPETTTLGYMLARPGFGKTLTEGHVMSECVDHIMAGADTTAASMTYLLYTLARPENRRYQDRLREEVSRLPPPLDFRDVCRLPYLHTCVLESLRLHAPGPGSLQQRVVPAGEAAVLTTRGGSRVVLPPGTVVGAQPYSLHRSEAVFGARCDEFLPERWERADEKHLQVMKDAWITFGTGARVCLGMNLALLEIKAMMATVLRTYTIELPKNFDHESVEPVYAAVIRPRDEKCPLLFSPIAPSTT